MAGNGKITADEIRLIDGGSVAAGSFSGQGGNLSISASKALVLNHQGLIYTSSFGTGNGGNIQIDAPILLGLNNSDIAANAIQGSGGQVKISSQGIFGLQYRDRPTLGNDITASSEFGVSGEVEIVNPGVDPNSSLVKLPENIVDSSRQIQSGCQDTQRSQFIITGRGGIAIDPTQTIMAAQSPWQDVRNNQVESSQETSAKTGEKTTIARSQPTPPVEANAWATDPQGNIQLMASGERSATPNASICATAFITGQSVLK